MIDDPELALQICQLHAVLETEQSHLTRQELFLMTFADLAKGYADVRLMEPARGLERQAVRRYVSIWMQTVAATWRSTIWQK